MEGGIIMSKVINLVDFKNEKRNKSVKENNCIENKYIKAWETLSEEEKLLLQELLED